MTRLQMFAVTAASAGAAAAVALGLAGTASAAGGADAIVNDLNAEGYSVRINGAQSANLSACAATDVKKDGVGGPGPTAYVQIVCPDGC